MRQVIWGGMGLPLSIALGLQTRRRAATQGHCPRPLLNANGTSGWLVPLAAVTC